MSYDSSHCLIFLGSSQYTKTFEHFLSPRKRQNFHKKIFHHIHVAIRLCKQRDLIYSFLNLTRPKDPNVCLSIFHFISFNPHFHPSYSYGVANSNGSSPCQQEVSSIQSSKCIALFESIHSISVVACTYFILCCHTKLGFVSDKTL